MNNEGLIKAKEIYCRLEEKCIREELGQLNDGENIAISVYNSIGFIPSERDARAEAYRTLCLAMKGSTFLYPVDGRNDPLCEFEDSGRVKYLPVFSTQSEAGLGDCAKAALNVISFDGLCYLMRKYGITKILIDGDGYEPIRIYQSTAEGIAAGDYEYQFILGS